MFIFFFCQAEDGIRDLYVTGVQTCALPISPRPAPARAPSNTKRVEVPNDDRFEALVGEVARLLPAGAPLGFNSDGEIAWIVTSGNVDLAALVERARARIGPST